MAEVLYFERDESTPLVHLTWQFPIGALADPSEQDGLSCHAAELARRGARGLSRTELDDALDAIGASLEFQTGYECTRLEAACLSKHLDALMELAAALLEQRPLEGAEHEQLVRESRQDLSESLDDDEHLASRFFRRYAFPDHCYARSILGTDASLAGITLEKSQAMFGQIIKCSGSHFGAVGDLTRADAERATRLGSVNLDSDAAAAIAIQPSPQPAQQRRAILVDKSDRNQCQLVLGHEAPTYGSDDFLALLVAEAALGGLECSRLNQSIRVRGGWTYSISTHIDRFRGPGFFSIHMAPSNEGLAPALAQTLSELGEFRDRGLTQVEFDFARGHLVGGLAFAGETARRRMNLRLRAKLFGLPGDSVQFVLEHLEALTLERVQQAIQTWIRPEELCLTMVGDPTMLAPLAETHAFEPSVYEPSAY